MHTFVVDVLPDASSVSVLRNVRHAVTLRPCLLCLLHLISWRLVPLLLSSPSVHFRSDPVVAGCCISFRNETFACHRFARLNPCLCLSEFDSCSPVCSEFATEEYVRLRC